MRHPNRIAGRAGGAGSRAAADEAERRRQQRDKALLAALARLGGGGPVTASVLQLSVEAGIGERAVGMAAGRLVAAGRLRVVRAGRSKPATYTVQTPAAPEENAP